MSNIVLIKLKTESKCEIKIFSVIQTKISKKKTQNKTRRTSKFACMQMAYFFCSSFIPIKSQKRLMN